jgi:quercetin dioxygenase-like cupin family protein
MNISSLPFTITNWEAVPETEHPGATGVARMRTIQAGELRVRLVEYSANYLADHWCTLGHFVQVLEGELIMELEDGRAFTISSGESFQVADNLDPHRGRTTTVPARVLVID